MKRSLENMNIALVHEWITNVAGAEKVLLALKELFPKAPIYTAVYDEKKAAAFKGFDIRTSFLQNIPFMKKKREILIPFTPIAFEQFDLSKYDLVISSTTVAAKGVITKPETIHVSYCHTPTRYLWDPQVDPRAVKGAFQWLRKKTIHQMRIWDRVAADRVDYFMSNSKYIADRIKKVYKRDAEVIYPPIDVERFTVLPETEIADYYLFVSRLVDYKRCDIVIEAFNKLNLPLKVVGYGPDRKKLQSSADKNVEFLGGKFGEELRSIFSHAKALVFAAEEDFGIVPVEAMAAGRPVIAFRKGGQSESIIDGETGVLFDEQNAESIIDAVMRLDKLSLNSAKIRLQAEKFTKEIFKKNILDHLNKIISTHKL